MSIITISNMGNIHAGNWGRLNHSHGHCQNAFKTGKIYYVIQYGNIGHCHGSSFWYRSQQFHSHRQWQQTNFSQTFTHSQVSHDSWIQLKFVETKKKKSFVHWLDCHLQTNIHSLWITISSVSCCCVYKHTYKMLDSSGDDGTDCVCVCASNVCYYHRMSLCHIVLAYQHNWIEKKTRKILFRIAWLQNREWQMANRTEIISNSLSFAFNWNCDWFQGLGVSAYTAFK